MALNGTMVKIDTVTVTAAGGQTAIEFTNIPQTYTDLLVKFSLRSARAGTWRDGMKVSFNGSTTNFSYRMLETTGSSAGSYSGSDGMVGNIPAATATASTFGSFELYVPNYTSSTNKSYSGDSVQPNNSSDQTLNLVAGLWSNTAAITSLKITADNGNMVQYSTATLYGISRTSAPIKATGGMVYDTDTHVYHLFTSSGTFTPLQNLTCDYLVIAGGGGGGYGHNNFSSAGGGGAGGYRTTVGTSGGNSSAESPLSLTANTGYTVTIGAGGAGDTNGGGSNGSNSVFSTITSTGGGRGAGGYPTIYAANTGGSGGGGGGGGGGSSQTAGAATTSATQGYAGGNGANGGSNFNGGGGGGAGSVGSASNDNGGGNGGSGISSSITGTAESRAGGGGGGSYNETAAGTGGTGGGGNGGKTGGGVVAPTAGTANTGGGGGGGGADASTSQNGAAGGSGLVIVRYAK